MYHHSFLQYRRRLQLETRRERIIFEGAPYSSALAVPRQPKNSGSTSEAYCSVCGVMMMMVEVIMKAVTVAQ